MMRFQRIFLLGAGAIGSTYGALLSPRNNVTLIASKAHVEAVNRSGLTLKGDINGKFFIPSETAIKEIPPDTLIVLTTKAYDAAEAVTRTKHLLRQDTPLLVLQNGLGIKNNIEKILDGKAETVRGVVTLAAEFSKLG